jgi:hypothetical protein
MNPVDYMTTNFHMKFCDISNLITTPSFPKLLSFPDFQNKILHSFLISAMHSTCAAHLILLVIITLVISGENYIL